MSQRWGQRMNQQMKLHLQALLARLSKWRHDVRAKSVAQGTGDQESSRSGIFGAIAERARRNQKWAQSREADYRVEGFQNHFPDSRFSRLRQYAMPLTILGAMAISAVFIASVAHNLRGSEDELRAEVQAGNPTFNIVEQGSAIDGPVDPLDELPAGIVGQEDAGPASQLQQNNPVPTVSLVPVPGDATPVEPAAAEIARIPVGTTTDRARGGVVLGTGKVTGVYFPTGGAICKLFNQQTGGGNAACTVSSTDGSFYNLNALRSGAIDGAIVQSDWQHHAFEGSRELAAPGAFTQLRSMFSVYVEPLNIIARGESGIRTLQDLRGRRIAMGAPNSVHNKAMQVLISAMGWNSTDFEEINTEPVANYLEALCLGEVDAVVLVAGHPNGVTMSLTNSRCGGVLVDISSPEIDELIAATPYLGRTVIPGEIYPGNPNPIRSFGHAATFVVASDLPDETAYDLVRSVFERFDEFRSLHPTFGQAKIEEMITRALSAPIHPGALRYYQERGWL